MNETTTQNVPPKVMNERILGFLQRGEVEKVAQAGSDYTRLQIREDGFAFKIIPAEKATDDMLDRDLDERLRIIEELEPDSPGAKWVPFQTIPDGEYIYGSRYQVPFARVLTRKYQKDIDELRTYRQDLRKILTDNAIKDALAEIDGKFIDTCNAITDNHGGDGINLFTGKRQYLGLSGGITKDNWIEAKKLLPRGSTTMTGKFRLRNYIALMNDVTAQDWQKLDVEEIGDANVSRHFNEGLFQDAAFGVKTTFTIKDELVPDNVVYFFAAPQFLGKAYYLTDWTMFMKKEAFFIEMFSYWLGGFAFGNVAGVCKVDFDAPAGSGS
jgi:hypothetical protein